MRLDCCCCNTCICTPLVPHTWLRADGEEGEGGDEAAAAVAAVLNGAVALVVYKNAVAAFPDSVPFRAKFLEMLAPLHFPGRASLEVRHPRVACPFVRLVTLYAGRWGRQCKLAPQPGLE